MTIMPAANRVADSIRMHFDLFGMRGVLQRALSGVYGASNEFKASIPLSSQKILLRLGTTDVAAFEHVFIDEEYALSFARPPSIIVDAGANVGMSSVYFALHYPNAKIVAIEPERSNFDVLRRNAELFPRIIPINAALWGHEGVVQVHDGGGGHWGMRVAEAPSGATIPSTTVSALIKQLSISQIDLLKIDVEGAECEILADPSSWIGRVGVICAELHDRFRPGCSRIFALRDGRVPCQMAARRAALCCT